MKVRLQKRSDRKKVRFGSLPNYSLFAFTRADQSSPDLFIKVRDSEIARADLPQAVRADTLAGVYFSPDSMVIPVTELTATYEE